MSKEQFPRSNYQTTQMIRKCCSLHWSLIKSDQRNYQTISIVSSFVIWNYETFQIIPEIVKDLPFVKICISSQLYSSSAIFEYLKHLLTRSQYTILNCFLCCIAGVSCFSSYAIFSATLKTSNSRRGYWVSGLIFVSPKYQIYQSSHSFMCFCTENVRPINQKPNMWSSLTFSEAVLMTLSGIKQFTPKNVGLIVCLFKLFWLLLLSNILNFRNVALFV